MSKTVKMYPIDAKQPNRDKSSGLQGKCLKAVRRNGTSYTVACKYQNDPKYHHEWSNVEEIYKGKTIQCGRPSTKFCSHKTYYGIKGYRNTCPIAGISGTYTQPATLRLFFDLEKKGILSNTKINKVKVSLEHRCTGVDVSNGKETINWGPNFDGAKVYPNKHALTIKIGDTKKYFDKNPPLSSKFGSTGDIIFKNISYKDLKNGIDIIYGNNLETNPGNIYVRNIQLSVDYEDETSYLEVKQESKKLYTSDKESCLSTIDFVLEAGYKQGEKKMSYKSAPKILQDEIKVTTPNKKLITVEFRKKDDKRTVIGTLKDKTNVDGKKNITFYVEGTKIKKTITYEAKKRNKPEIFVPNQIEKNTVDNGITSIIVKNGCAENIKAYDNNLTSEPIYTFNNFDLSNKDNIVQSSQIEDFYKKLSSLSCGYHTILFRRDNESNKEVVEKVIEIIPTTYKFEITKVGETTPINFYRTEQNKTSNDKLLLKYIKTKELVNNPSFTITNSTHGKIVDGEPTKKVIGSYNWTNVNKDGDLTELPIGTYLPGTYNIKIEDSDLKCSDSPTYLKVNITPNHKQYFDEIFVRGEDSTAFNYEYLVALEGDSITQPIYVDSIKLGASYQDIKICADKSTPRNISRPTETKSFFLTIKNTSETNDIENLFLELNTLIPDENNSLQVTSNEWLEPGGIFYNFKENFEELNKSYSDIITIKNLTNDDDNVDEEDVYIHINQIAKEKEITLKIPYGCSTPKEVYLQILLFGEPINLYERGFCNDDSKIFNLIPLKVYDSVLTNMNIEGDTDLFETEIKDKCPHECFLTENGITYSITNIDTNSLVSLPETKIINDPRLVPCGFKYGDDPYNLKNGVDYPNLGLFFEINKEATKQTTISGAKIEAYIKFENHDEVYLNQYTDYNGEVLFFISLPSTIDGYYDTEELLKYMSVEYKGNYYYNGTKLTSTTYTGENRILNISDEKNFTYFEITKTPIKYYAGQVVPLRIKLIGQNKYLKNEILFKPQIKEPGSSDSVTIFYKICNLKGNEGILNTTFTTNVDENSYFLSPNEVSKKIYCGVKTDLEVKTQLSKKIVENNTINKLNISLINRKRNNKNVVVYISEEYNDIQKYDISDYRIEKGTLRVVNGEIVWEIDYLDENSKTNGYIELKAKNIGLSSLNVIAKDFIDEKENVVFGKESYKCECRKEIDYGEK